MGKHRASFDVLVVLMVFLVLVQGWAGLTSALALPSDDEWQHQSRLTANVQEQDRRQLLGSWPQFWGNEFNVLNYGAVGDGNTSDTKAFLGAWTGACAYEGGVMVVPEGYTFLVGPVLFQGPCTTNTAIQVDGTILALPSTSTEWNGETKRNWWLKLHGLNGLTIMGSGIIDGNGASWWCDSCKKADAGSRRCKAPAALKITQSTNVLVQQVLIRNAPQTHLKFDGASRVLVKHLKVIAPESSPNTDAISFANTQRATVEYSKFSTGDNCISILSGSFDIIVQHSKCGSGSGISIGALGAKGTTSCVSNIQVYNVTVKNASGALSVKTYQGGSGYVNQVDFEEVRVINVSNPIVIDQNYCNSDNCVKHEKSTKTVAIADISFRNIIGSYVPTDKAIYLACSGLVPCTEISMMNVNLWPTHGSRTRPEFKGGSVCSNAYGTSGGYSSTLGIEQCLISLEESWWKPTLEANEFLCPRVN